MSSFPDIYILDANVFIESAKRYYAFDLAPSFWDRLVNQASEGHIRSIDKVKTELDAKEDRLKDWANSHFTKWFQSTHDIDVLSVYQAIMKWVETSDFRDKAKKDFTRTNTADAWIVAYAKAKRCIVVTDEQYDPDIRRKILIPNVCELFGIKCMNTFQMLRELNITL